MIPSTITAIKTRAVLSPLARPITTAVGKIPDAPLILIDVETSAGVTGSSYIFTYSPIAIEPIRALIDNLTVLLKGKPVQPLDRMAEMEAAFRLLGRQGFVAMALSGLDMAFWDICGKKRGESVAALLGASETPVPCYASFGLFDPSGDPAILEETLSRGVRHVKFKVGRGGLEEDIADISRIREIIGGDTGLMIDYNQSLSTPEASRRIRALEARFDLHWVEEPISAEDFAGHAQLRRNIATPLQTGENWWLPDDAARAAQAGISDHAMLDIMKIGGFTGWSRAAAVAVGASLPVSSHLFIEASAHALAATPNRHLLEYLDIAGGILRNPLSIENGCVRPQGPGIGMEWDEAQIRKYAV